MVRGTSVNSIGRWTPIFTSPPLSPIWGTWSFYYCRIVSQKKFLFFQANVIEGPSRYTWTDGRYEVATLDLPVTGSNLGPGPLPRAIWRAADRSVNTVQIHKLRKR